MFTEYKSCSLMGVPNPEMYFSDKDLKSMEFNFLVRRKDGDCEIAIAPQELHQINKEAQEFSVLDELKAGEGKTDVKCKISVSSLKIKLPPIGAFRIEDEDEDGDDGLKTPTSLDHKIPVVFQCPPAPRKPKSIPSAKRKSPRRRRSVLLDLSNEIESLFPPALAADLGSKNKKARQGSDHTKCEGANYI